MKIVFMGTPDFAAVCLEALAQSGNEIGYAVSQPDKAKDRGKKLQATPVKEMAEKYGIPVLQPEKIKGNEEFISTLREYAPDLIAVAAYGRIIPKEILELPRLGCVNVHGSLLPKYRGAAPVQRAIIDGETVTGVTLMQMGEGLDTGDMMAKAEIEIGDRTSDELMAALAETGARLLVDNLSAIEDGSIKREKQDDSLATYAGMISKEDGRIDFTKTPAEIERQIRGVSPWPGAYTTLDGETFKIWRAEATDTLTEAVPGTVVSTGNDGICIAAGGKILKAVEVQAPGKKRMSAGDYVRGRKLETGTVLGK